MSALEETITKNPAELSARSGKRESIVSRFMRWLCSVRLGVTLLVLLGFACLVGMLIMQQNVEGFSNYYYTLTPAQRLVYGKLGFFDIYHAWYFNALLCFLSLNIVLASIDRFPKTWTYISKPNVTVPIRWLREQSQSAVVSVQGDREAIAKRIESAIRSAGWRGTVRAEKNGRLFIFGQSGVWNRLGAYAVHVGLLTIFLGGFLTAQLGTTGQLPLSPGQKTNLIFDTVVDLDKVNQVTKQLPFEVAFTDIQQKLIKKEGPISASNTIDWITRFTITDDDGPHEAMVQMNRPFDYRGYRFFQASFTSIGRARNITVRLNPADGGAPQEVTIPRDGTATLADGTRIKFAEFRGNFRIGKDDPNEDTSSYPNPAAVLQVIPPNAPPQTAYAFGPQMANIPVAKKPVAGYTYQLVDFEKVSDQHILSVQRDPGANVVYVGFVLLFLTLVGVFFFSHQRVWAAIEEKGADTFEVTLGGNTNRSQNAFDEKFKRFVSEIGKPRREAEVQ
jgi:cytochrome c biogenesis protein